MFSFLKIIVCQKNIDQNINLKIKLVDRIVLGGVSGDEIYNEF